ncbi:MAG: hypothetical protein PF693_02755 [Spirochaetia bacterium]|jgi:hypothetical protein|nr:hypothetical protein [Spirochaetia bacterium]
MDEKSTVQKNHSSLKSIREILEFTIKECVQFFHDIEDPGEADIRARKELMLMDILIERFEHYGHLTREDLKDLKYIIWNFAVEAGWLKEMPEI